MKLATSPSSQKWLILAALILFTWLAYYPVIHNSFINLDDVQYVTANPHIQRGVNAATVKWAFTTFEASNWHPLTWLSHALDCQLYGLNPAGHHATSLVLHLCSVLVLFFLLVRLTGQPWPSGFAALLFALHPMHVESVAWVAERKDQLSALFLFLTLLAYTHYARARQAQRSGLGFYGLAIVLYTLGLLSKPMLVTVPCLMFLLDYWPLNRVETPSKAFFPSSILHPPSSQVAAQPRQLLMEKIPFVLLACASCMVTFLAQRHGNAVKDLADFPFADRVQHALVAYAWYLEKLFWPADLSAYYQLRRSEPLSYVMGAATLLLGISVFAICQARRRPFLLVGWLWFLIMLMPVIGLVQVGNQAWADRYTYLPYVGLSFMITWGARSSLQQYPRWVPLACILAVTASGCWFWLARQQVQYWKNARTLFAQAVHVDQYNEHAWTLLGLEYMMNENDVDQATNCFQRAVAINPRSFYGWFALSHAQVLKGDYAAAEVSLRTAISDAPNRPDQYVVLADILAKTGRYPEAIEAIHSAMALNANLPGIHARLGSLYVMARMPDRALPELRQAIAADPQDADAEFNLAQACEQTGQLTEAAAHYRRTVALDPANTIAANNLAWWLATAPDSAQRDGPEAMRLAERACNQTHYRQPLLMGTFAAACAQAGRFDDAISLAQQACVVAAANGQTNLLQRNQELLERYRQHLPAVP